MPYVEVWVDECEACDCPSKQEIEQVEILLAASYERIRLALSHLQRSDVRMAIAELETAIFEDPPTPYLSPKPTEIDERYARWVEAGKPAPIIEFEAMMRKPASLHARSS